MSASETGSDGLVITLFGPLQVRIGGHPLPPLRSRKALWLLALLTLRHDRPVEREWLAGTLWPEVNQTRAFSNLRAIVSELRHALGSQSYRLQSPNRHALLLDLTGADVDVRAFDAAVGSRNSAALERAVLLYRGPLLEGCTEEWVFAERETREQDCLRALQTLGDAALGAGDYETAVGYYRRALGMDPWQETARRGLMNALAQTGDRNAALQVYREYVARLRETPQAVPEEKTRALYRHLRKEASPPIAYPTEVSSPTSTPEVNGYIPHALTELIGREEERIEAADCLRRSRLVTLTGVGGIGKTRLATVLARDIACEYADGVWQVALESLSEGPQVLAQIASVLGVKEEAGRDLTACVTEHLRRKRQVLMLDNCEHLIEACAEASEHILRECAGVRILATSREALGVTGEMVWIVPMLTVPDVEHLPEASEALLPWLVNYEAVELFVKRAQAAQSNFNLTGRNARVIAQICIQLEGIPLAIELAASQIKGNSLEQIHAHLDDFLGMGSVKSAPSLSRQETLRATLDWSYALLTESERLLLQRLSVFTGGWTLEAAEAICTDSTSSGATKTSPCLLKPSDVLPLLAALIDKSLVTFVEGEAETGGRFRMLEMVRQFAGERLAVSSEARLRMTRHQDWFVALAEEAEPQLSGPEQMEWLRRLTTEYDNLRVIFSRSEQGAPSAESVLRLAGALWQFWYVRGDYSEGRRYLAQALLRGDTQAITLVRAKALNGAGAMAYRQGDYAVAQVLFEESLAIRRELRDGKGVAETIGNLGTIQNDLGNYSFAQALYEESLSIRRQVGDRYGVTTVLSCMAHIAQQQGDFARAKGLLEESLLIYNEWGDQYEIAWALYSLGNVASAMGDLIQAQTLYEESLSHRQQLGDRQGIAWIRHHQGAIAHHQEDYARAQALNQESLKIFREMGEKHGMAASLQGLGDTAFAQGEFARAHSLYEASLSLFKELQQKNGTAWTLGKLGNMAYVQGDTAAGRALFTECLPLFKEMGAKLGIVTTLRTLASAVQGHDACFAVSLWGAAQTLWESLGTIMPIKDQEKYEQLVSQARLTMGEEAFIAAWEAGRALTWEQATDYALEKLNAEGKE